MSEVKLALEALYRCEAEVVQLRREAGQLPVEIEKGEARAQVSRDALAAERGRVEEAEQVRRAKEAELADCEEQKLKYQGQTSQVKTNEEYTALLSQIDGMTRRISEVEEEILLAMDAADDLRGKLGPIESEKKAEEAATQREVEEWRKRLAEIESTLGARDRERDQLSKPLPPRALSIYNRGYASLGSGTARVVENICTSCHRDVPFETINRVIQGEALPCGNCTRLLVEFDS